MKLVARWLRTAADWLDPGIRFTSSGTYAPPIDAKRVRIKVYGGGGIAPADPIEPSGAFVVMPGSGIMREATIGNLTPGGGGPGVFTVGIGGKGEPGPYPNKSKDTP